MKLESLDAAFVIDTFLLLLIGIGPKSRWCRSSRRPSRCRSPRNFASCARC